MRSGAPWWVWAWPWPASPTPSRASCTTRRTYPAGTGSPLKPIVEERLCLRCRVANDASLAALAEHVYGAGRGLRHLIYITVSTGIGGGIIVDGKPYSGARGLAGEIGHMTIDRNGPRCRCGNLGCLEAMASGTAAARMARDRLVAGEASVLLDRCGGDPDKVEAQMVAEVAASGDVLAHRSGSGNLNRGISGIAA